MKKIVIEIDKDGTVHMEALGFEGQGCHDALRELQQRLGKEISSTKKPEFYKAMQKSNVKVKE
jgi:hypothetical protein